MRTRPLIRHDLQRRSSAGFDDRNYIALGKKIHRYRVKAQSLIKQLFGEASRSKPGIYPGSGLQSAAKWHVVGHLHYQQASRLQDAHELRDVASNGLLSRNMLQH